MKLYFDSFFLRFNSISELNDGLHSKSFSNSKINLVTALPAYRSIVRLLHFSRGLIVDVLQNEDEGLIVSDYRIPRRFLRISSSKSSSMKESPIYCCAVESKVGLFTSTASACGSTSLDSILTRK